jgi:hypothetical protein
VQHATSVKASRVDGDGHKPSRHLLAAAASASNGSGAGCGAAFPLVEATISGVHVAFLNGTLSCSQLVAVRERVTIMNFVQALLAESVIVDSAVQPALGFRR